MARTKAAAPARRKLASMEPLLNNLVERINRASKQGEQHAIRIQLVGKEPEEWSIETVEGRARLSRGAGPANPSLEVIAEPAAFRAILEGKKEGRAAFLAGGIRVRGDVGAAERLSAAMGTHKPSGGS